MRVSTSTNLQKIAGENTERKSRADDAGNIKAEKKGKYGSKWGISVKTEFMKSNKGPKYGGTGEMKNSHIKRKYFREKFACFRAFGSTYFHFTNTTASKDRFKEFLKIAAKLLHICGKILANTENISDPLHSKHLQIRQRIQQFPFKKFSLPPAVEYWALSASSQISSKYCEIFWNMWALLDKKKNVSDRNI